MRSSYRNGFFATSCQSGFSSKSTSISGAPMSAASSKAVVLLSGGSDPNAIPSTYVPARNTVMLALALAWAEVLGAYDIFIGVNSLDYSGYPDCRPEFIDAFEKMATLATKAGVEGKQFRIQAPLISLTKAQIVQ